MLSENLCCHERAMLIVETASCRCLWAPCSTRIPHHQGANTQRITHRSHYHVPSRARWTFSPLTAQNDPRFRPDLEWSRALRTDPQPATRRPAEAAGPSHRLGESGRTLSWLSACAIWPGRLGGGSARCIPPLVGRVPLSSQYATSEPIRASLLTMADTAHDMQCLASQQAQKQADPLQSSIRLRRSHSRIGRGRTRRGREVP